jgi:hypothetical protein
VFQAVSSFQFFQLEFYKQFFPLPCI